MHNNTLHPYSLADDGAAHTIAGKHSIRTHLKTPIIIPGTSTLFFYVV
jgi:hypothetical protein